MTERAVIGIDIGGTKIAGCVYAGGEIQHRVTQWTPAEAKPASLRTAAHPDIAEQAGRDALLQIVGDVIAELRDIAHAEDITIAGVGIGSAGQIDPARGIVIDASENLVGWKDTPVKAILEDRLSLPVIVDNDVNTMALAESQLAAGRDYEHVFYVAVGTGIGGALVLNGRIWHGAQNSAGEIGYLVTSMDKQGNPHRIEESASGPGMEAWYEAQTGTRLTLHQIVARATANNEIARRTIADGAQVLAKVLAPVAFFVSPQALIIGGGVPSIGALWWQPFRETFYDFPRRTLREIALIEAGFGSDAVLIGAAVMAANHWLGDR